MVEIKKIKKVSLANASALLFSAAGFLLAAGIYGYALFAALKSGQTAQPLSEFIWFNVGVGSLSAIFVAFFAGLISWFVAFLAAGLYNVFAKRSGGIKLEVDGLAAPQPSEDRQRELFPF